MRINSENKSMDMEARDINYILPTYVRSYLFYSKNEMPSRIIFPMFPSVKVGGVDIPIEYVHPLDKIAVEITEDGKDVAEVTPEQEAALDAKDNEIADLKAQIAKLETTPEAPAPEDITRQQQEDKIPDEPPPPARAAFTEAAEERIETAGKFTGESVHKVEKERYEEKDRQIQEMSSAFRQPKQPPGGDIGPGSSLSDMHPRDGRDQTRTARDLLPEPDIAEAEEKPFEKEIKRGEDGKPIVEDKAKVIDKGK